MTTTETAQVVVTYTDAGTLCIAPPKGPAMEVTPAEAERLAWALERAVYKYAPKLEHVLGILDDDDRPRRVDLIPAGIDPIHGLACPHCRFVAWDDYEDDEGVIVVDGDERWSHLHYTIRQVPEIDCGTGRPTGREVEQRAITGWYLDRGADWEGVGYRCGSCTRPVRLPDDVEEAGR